MRALAALLAAALGAGCRCAPENGPVPVSGNANECLLAADNRSGVIGMDGASSIALDGDRSLFLFGDTFFGGWRANGARDVYGSADSTALIVSNAEAGSCFAHASFVGGDSPRSIVSGPPGKTSDHRLWPGAGLARGATLFLSYSYVRTSSGGFGFSGEGSGIARGTVDPLAVTVSASNLAPASEPAAASAIAVDGETAYVYRCRPGSEAGTGWYPCVAARTAVATLDDRSTWRYFVAGRGWDGSLADASIVTEGAAELTITFNMHLGAWLLVYVEPFGSEVSMRTAPAPEGPFSDKRKVWPCTLPGSDPKAFCYGAKLHPQLGSADGRTVAITYNTNTSDLQALASEPALYWPRLVRIDLDSL